MPRILIIAGEENFRSVLKYHLAGANYEVIEADDGGDAIQKLHENENFLEIDAAICDIRIPNIYGINAFSYFQMKYANLPLIVMADSHQIQLAESLLKNGVKAYLIKPVEKDSLLAIVRKVIS